MSSERSDDTLYHIIVTRTKRNVPVRHSELLGVLDYLHFEGVQPLSVAYHNHGRYSQLHIHILALYSGRYKCIRHTAFNIRFERVCKTLSDIKRVLSYIHQGVSCTHADYQNDQVIEMNRHYISDQFLCAVQ